MLKQETCNEKLPSFNPWAYESFTQSTSSAFLVKRDNSYWINKSERHFLLSYMIFDVGFYSKIIITNHEEVMNLTMKLLLFFYKEWETHSVRKIWGVGVGVDHIDPEMPAVFHEWQDHWKIPTSMFWQKVDVLQND